MGGRSRPSSSTWPAASCTPSTWWRTQTSSSACARSSRPDRGKPQHSNPRPVTRERGWCVFRSESAQNPSKRNDHGCPWTKGARREMEPKTTQTDVVVIGGGMAGLTAACYLARAGADVTLFEKAPNLGGRAASQDFDGFRFNRGIHALYTGGATPRGLYYHRINFWQSSFADT